jgi:hypothetical protein
MYINKIMVGAAILMAAAFSSNQEIRANNRAQQRIVFKTQNLAAKVEIEVAKPKIYMTRSQKRQAYAFGVVGATVGLGVALWAYGVLGMALSLGMCFGATVLGMAFLPAVAVSVVCLAAGITLAVYSIRELKFTYSADTIEDYLPAISLNSPLGNLELVSAKSL